MEKKTFLRIIFTYEYNVDYLWILYKVTLVERHSLSIYSEINIYRILIFFFFFATADKNSYFTNHKDL